MEIEYVGRIKASGEIFDLTDAKVAAREGIFNPKVRYGPVGIVLGAGMVLKGLEDSILGMKVGDKKTITLEPKKAFGERSAALVKTFSADKFRRQGINPTQGQFIDIGRLRGRILSSSGGRISIDFNHPLSGKGIEYEVMLVRKVDKPEEQLKAIAAYDTNLDPEGIGAKLDGKKATITMPKEIKLPESIKRKISEHAKKHVKDISEVDFSEEKAKGGKEKSKQEDAAKQDEKSTGEAQKTK